MTFLVGYVPPLTVSEQGMTLLGSQRLDGSPRWLHSRTWAEFLGGGEAKRERDVGGK